MENDLESLYLLKQWVVPHLLDAGHAQDFKNYNHDYHWTLGSFGNKEYITDKLTTLTHTISFGGTIDTKTYKISIDTRIYQDRDTAHRAVQLIRQIFPIKWADLFMASRGGVFHITPYIPNTGVVTVTYKNSSSNLSHLSIPLVKVEDLYYVWKK
jgi:hypothetical protein